MNLEEFREYCLSLGEVEEKLPFAKMPGGDSVLVFYVSGHTFCYCDLNDLRVVVKCQPERCMTWRICFHKRSMRVKNSAKQKLLVFGF